jgi:hypothetical protein
MRGALLAATIAASLAAVPAAAQAPPGQQYPPQGAQPPYEEPQKRDRIRDVLDVLDAITRPPPEEPPQYKPQYPPPYAQPYPPREPPRPPRYEPPPPDPVDVEPVDDAVESEEPIAETRPGPRPVRPAQAAVRPAPPAPAPVVAQVRPAPAAPSAGTPPETPPVEATPPAPEPAAAAPAAEPALVSTPAKAEPPPVKTRATLLERVTQFGWWPLAALLAVIAAAVGAETYRRHRRLERTRTALALEPRLDAASGEASCSAPQFTAPPVSIRCRLELGTAHG